MTPDQASLASLLVIIPMFALLGIFGSPGVAFWILFGVMVFIKLTLNAVDGIIARERHESTRLGMMLNVGTDILPDLLMIGAIWRVYDLPIEIFFMLGVLILLYYIGEMIFIVRYDRQNLFYGKDLRTLLYAVILCVTLSRSPTWVIPAYYTFITLIHLYGFLLPSYRSAPPGLPR